MPSMEQKQKYKKYSPKVSANLNFMMGGPYRHGYLATYNVGWHGKDIPYAILDWDHPTIELNVTKPSQNLQKLTFK